jgi:hypothetical protein
MENKNASVDLGAALFGNNSGQWATRMLKAALEGKLSSDAALRTLDTLRHEEWKYFDDALSTRRSSASSAWPTSSAPAS